MNILITSALTLLTRSQTIAAAVDAAPLWWLIWQLRRRGRVALNGRFALQKS
jgi:hypothetical protein